MSLGIRRWRGKFPAGWAGLDVELCDATNYCVNSLSPYLQTAVTVDTGCR